jgi:ribosomal protein L24E
LLRLYVEEDPQVFLFKPTKEEWINKQNRVPTTFTKTFVEKHLAVFKQRQKRLQSFCNYRLQGVFFDCMEEI